MNSPIIEIQDLLKLLPSTDLILVDASGSKNAQANYGVKHLQGALRIDLNAQLADVKGDPTDGGRHPLPRVEQFSQTLAELGIQPNSHVVIYDDANGSNAASRFWWMLRSVGHEQVQVLNGNLAEAEKAGYPTTAEMAVATNAEMAVAPKVDSYPVTQWLLPTADIHEVERVAQDVRYCVIDVRAAERYRGETEPIDLVAGHIPGAINIPFAGNLDAEGHFLSAEVLRKKYEEVFNNKSSKDIIVHCGSGVTACHTLLAMEYAGFEVPKLYVGSWGEWSRAKPPRL